MECYGSAPQLSVPEFVKKWHNCALTERSAAHQHFLDLCHVLGKATPAQADQAGDFYTFERGVKVLGGRHGWADVWFKGHFAWEYKSKDKDLIAAYRQLQKYREDLENPPLLVVCDLERFEVHTQWAGERKQVYKFELNDLLSNKATATCALPPLAVLDALWNDPELLRPTHVSSKVTEEAAQRFAELAKSLRDRGVDPQQAAHFLMRLLFCLFANSINLLPEKLFTKLIENTRGNPHQFTEQLKALFAAMANPDRWWGPYKIDWFNGGLFADDTVFDLTSGDMMTLTAVANLDWSSIEPAIFGTLFERSLDPSKRSQLGAHYTSKEDILLIVEPVLMEPLRRRWDEVREKAIALAAQLKTAKAGAYTKLQTQLKTLLLDFCAEIAATRVLDPACGSGNFLYVALKLLLDLEHEVRLFAHEHGLPGILSEQCGPEQLYGIELNVYAHELASVVVWIGYLQWLHDTGSPTPTRPVLKPLKNIENKDAVLAFNADGKPVEPDWPEADIIIGNPPFLGGKKMRTELGDTYVNGLFALYEGRVPHEADLVTYWFERARARIAAGPVRRAGLLATQGIRGGANRKVLERIKETGDIFWAISDREWILEGANVNVSMVGFDRGEDAKRMLDNEQVELINADLTARANLPTARPLPENAGIAYMGDTKVGPFDISHEKASEMLNLPLNVNGRSNADVIRPWINAWDLTRRPRNMFIIDFGCDMTEDEAASYEAPFEYVRANVLPERAENNRKLYREQWWIHGEPRPSLRAKLARIKRFISSPGIAKHRLFVWVPSTVLPDHAVFAFTRDDDYFFGVLHSRAHELWALGQGTQLEDRPRYTPTSTFETFPFPWSPGKEPQDDPKLKAIAAAAKDLVEKRDAWLNPPDAAPAELKKRTLTNLYNQSPTWLQQLHRKLDEAVFAAYGWPADLSDSEILERLLALNHQRAAAQKST